MVGSSLACAIAPLRRSDVALRIAVVEADEYHSATQTSFDERTVALTYASKQIFSGLQVWENLRTLEATPITHIHVSDRGHAGATILRADDVKVEALGYVVPHRVVGETLIQQLLGFANVSLFTSTSVKTLTTDKNNAIVSTSRDGQDKHLSASLVVIADGGRSSLAKQAGLISDLENYENHALVTGIQSDRENNHGAFERFTRDGPLALLPKGKRGYAVVWTLPQDRALQLQEAPEDEFLNLLQTTFGYRAGNFLNCTNRNIYPLSKHSLDNPAGNRTVALGNAAHTVHPVAGQGFNLGLRDVAELATQVRDTLDKSEDIGSRQLLDRYSQARKKDTHAVGVLTHGLIKTFANDIPVLRSLRGLGLGLLDTMPMAKRALLERTMGLYGCNSPLVFGQSLAEKSYG